MTATATATTDGDGDTVRVGDTVGFKCDTEQSGTITKEEAL
jgi:hypothetical protein